MKVRLKVGRDSESRTAMLWSESGAGCQVLGAGGSVLGVSVKWAGIGSICPSFSLRLCVFA